MKIKYDKEADVLNIKLSNSDIAETDEEKPGIIFDYDKDGKIVEIEILNASQRVSEPQDLEYEAV